VDRVGTFSVATPYGASGRQGNQQLVDWVRARDIPVTRATETFVRAERH
jgi:hypothetical protein